MSASIDITDESRLPAAAKQLLENFPSSRVFAFHPIGFPGRRSRLEATVVIVDDVWALVGASTFRRRGLTFDGATDVVLTDTVLEESVCPALRDFRRGLLAARLGIAPTSPSPFGAMPELLCRAELVDKLQAVCHSCGGPATMTQRLVDGAPAPANGATIVVGALEQYEARCRSCHQLAAPALAAG